MFPRQRPRVFHLDTTLFGTHVGIIIIIVVDDTAIVISSSSSITIIIRNFTTSTGHITQYRPRRSGSGGSVHITNTIISFLVAIVHVRS